MSKKSAKYPIFQKINILENGKKNSKNKRRRGAKIPVNKLALKKKKVYLQFVLDAMPLFFLFSFRDFITKYILN